MNEPFLTTERLCLRSLQEADFPDYAAYATDDEMSRMMGRALLKTEADIRQNFDWLKNREPRCYGIVERSSNHLIGNLSICTVPAPLSAHPALQGKTGQTLSFCIRRECQRKGYASEAIRAVIQELFLVERLDYVQCGCYSFNKPSLHLQKQLGFQFLGNLFIPATEGPIETIENILWNPDKCKMR